VTNNNRRSVNFGQFFTVLQALNHGPKRPQRHSLSRG